MEGQFSSKMANHVTKMWLPLKSGCLLKCNGNYKDIINFYIGPTLASVQFHFAHPHINNKIMYTIILSKENKYMNL